MTYREVWYEIVVGGQAVDDVFEIELEQDKPVDEIRSAVKERWGVKIGLAVLIKVYLAGTDPDSPDESKRLKGNVEVPTGEGTQDKPLVVIAPKPEGQRDKRERESEDKSAIEAEPSKKRLRSIGNAFVTATESGQSRVLPAWNRELQESKREPSSEFLLPIFERETYRALAEKLRRMEYKRQVVTGMPGIGKSWFVDYFAQLCLKKGDAVILETDRPSALTEASEARRLELLVPSEDGAAIEHVQSVSFFSSGDRVLQFVKDMKTKVGERRCWNLIDYQDEKWGHVLHSGALPDLLLVLFASPARQRWKNFFITDAEKGQEPILIMPVWTGNELGTLWEKTEQDIVSLEELDVLVSLFGPSPRYCFSQFCFENVGKDGSERDEERAALETAALADAKRAAPAGRCSSSDLLEKALAQLNEPLREKAHRAAQLIRGRIMTPGVVEELEDIHDSPTGSTRKSNVSSRLLIWGVHGNSFSMDAGAHRPYVAYASPYIAALVLEHNSKQALRSMARFLESGDGNVGAGSGWMYENFLLKYYFPSLKTGHETVLHVIGTSETKKFTLPSSYDCTIFGELNHASFQDGAMCIPAYRDLGAVDCFMILNETLYLFQVTIAASHSIVKGKLEDLINLAGNRCTIKSVELVFVIPEWRKTDYLAKAQGRKIVRITNDIKRDTKETLSKAIAALEDLEEDNRQELRDLLNQKKNDSTHRARRKLKDLFAERLRKNGYQDDSLETWSVPRLLAAYTSEEFLSPKLVAGQSFGQSIWVVGKKDMPETSTGERE